MISVGNLRVGGTGKTPVVAHLCELLRSHGERPAILSRGYGRTQPTSGVTVVSDGNTIIADLAAAGDEPLMLARALPSVPVLVGTDRFECGRRGEREFDISVHVLDDGFQHLTLARDIDLLLVDEHDLSDQVLPAGRLREPLANAAAAHALLVTADNSGAVDRVAHQLRVPDAFHVLRAIHAPRSLDGESAVHVSGERVLAFAGIARPQRFFADLAASGRRPVETIAFADHHQFTQKDVDRIVERARAASATVALTTEKDAVRLARLDFKGLPVDTIPLSVSIEPAAEFQRWLFNRLHSAQATTRASQRS